jgi:Protein of unknown function (DUF3431)
VTVELVVARYREDVGWLRNIPKSIRVSLYDKGEEPVASGLVPAAHHERLANVGREAHTYVHHILTRWDDLADVLVFVQGRPFDHCSDLHPTLRTLALSPGQIISESGFRWLGFLIDTDDPRGRRLYVPWSKNPERIELAVDEFYVALFGREVPEWFRFYGGGQFVVRRELVLARGRAFWERAMRLAMDFPDAAHCFERTWDHVFGVVGVDPALLGGELCRVLKPVKRHTA